MSENDLEQFYQKLSNGAVPLQRPGTAKEVANVIEFVASDKVSFFVDLDCNFKFRRRT